MHRNNGDFWIEEKVERQFVSNMTEEISVPVRHHLYKIDGRTRHIPEEKYKSLCKAQKAVEAMTCR